MQTEQDLEKLVRTYTPALLRYCTGILGSEHDAQDAVQQTFIKAWQHRHTLREGEPPVCGAQPKNIMCSKMCLTSGCCPPWAFQTRTSTPLPPPPGWRL